MLKMPKVLIIGLVIVAIVSAHEPFRLTYQWEKIEPVWPNDEVREEAILRHEYIPENIAISGIKLWKNSMFLTLPRWKPGVPVTLAITSAIPQHGDTAPTLKAFPTWKMQRIGRCRSFQFVQSMEIDPMGRMWVLDTGRTETNTLLAKTRCPPRLVILDLENKGKLLRSYPFPPDVVSNQTAYLNDIVVDHEDGGYAYITDSSEDDPGIVVFCLKTSTSWKIRHSSMHAEEEAIELSDGKILFSTPVNVDSIALSPVGSASRYIYYCPLSSYHLYSLPTAVLKNGTTDVHRFVEELGRKKSQADGMIMTSRGVLYFGALSNNGVVMWDTEKYPSFSIGQRGIFRDNSVMIWPDSFATDENGTLWLVASSAGQLTAAPENKMDITVPNYRIFRANIGTRNYQYYEDGSTPVQPTITALPQYISFLTMFPWLTYSVFNVSLNLFENIL